MVKTSLTTLALLLSGSLLFNCVNKNSQKDGGSAPQRTDWREVRSWAYQLQSVNFQQLEAGEVDLLVLDPNPEAEADGRMTPSQIQRLQRTGKRVVAYLSVGEAESYRPYWDKSWKQHPPTWLGKENPKWPENYPVHYWDPEWQILVSRELDAIVSEGYDGVYFDIVDGYEAFEGQGDTKARQRMVDFVLALAARARTANPKFGVFAQNAEALTQNTNFSNALDGLGREGLFYGYGGDNQPTPPEVTKELAEQLSRFAQTGDGKLVLLIDYTNREPQIADCIRRSRDLGFVPYVAPRGLEKLQDDVVRRFDTPPQVRSPKG